MTRGLGYKPDVHDAGDAEHKLSAKIGALFQSPPPASASLERPDVGPKDQGPTSSCTGQATAQAVRLGYLHQGTPCPELSALDVYFRSRAAHGEQDVDAGSYLRTSIRAVKDAGIADEYAWPFSEFDVNRSPNMLARRSAYDRRGVRSYHRIDPGDVDGVRRAIAAGYPVIGGWMIDQRFLDWNGQGVISGQIMPVGGHALPIVGYAADGTFRLLNSWGRGWGREGYAVTDDMFIASGSDVWAVAVNP